jgi:hypothetical protein
VIEYLLCSVALVLLSILLLGLGLQARRMALRLFPVRILVELIFFFVLVKISLYYCLPTLLRIASDYRFEHEDNVAIIDLVSLYGIELISWTLWALAFLGTLALLSRDRRVITVDETFQLRRRESTTLLVIITLGFVTLQVTSLARVDLNAVFEVFKSLFFYAGLASGPFLMCLSLRYYGKSLFALGASASLLALLSLSTRGAIVYLMLFSFFLVWFVLRDRKSKVIVMGGFLTLALSYFVFGGLFAGSVVIDDTGQLSLDLGVNAEKKGERSALEEVEWRFGASTRMGTAFLKLYNRGAGAGFNPIKHSFQGFLPRSLDPDKPQPSTLDGDDMYSQGMYLISNEINGWDSYSMVEFPTGAHFYWEFGILGVLVLSAISGVYIAACAYFFARLGAVALPLMVAVFKPWGYVDPKIWISDVAMQLYQVILPLLVLVFVVRSVRSLPALYAAVLRFAESGARR